MNFGSLNIQELQLEHSLEVNASSGSASGVVKIPLSDGRNGFSPQLSLHYSSSSRNSIFGIGWSLDGLASISIDTQKGLPKYDGTDQFVFNGATSLVPFLEKTGSTYTPKIEETSTYWVYYYRAKLENNFTRFEKWVRKSDNQIHWRTQTTANVVSIFGLETTGVTKINDPKNPHKTFIWLLEAQYDHLGNAILYKYKKENEANVDSSTSYENNRIRDFLKTGFSQKYPEKILYGNTKPLLPDEETPDTNKWLFKVVFDYGEYEERPYNTDQPVASSTWPQRLDPFSIYSPGFEVRSYRLCKRLLLYHDFEELATPSLVGIVENKYNESSAGTTLESIKYTGIRKDLFTNVYSEKQLPEITFQYTEPVVGSSFNAIIHESNENLPQGFNNSNTQLVDLFGEGLPGILTESAESWYYKPNLGNGLFGKQEVVIQKPSQLIGTYSLGDFDQDGNLNLFSLQGQTAGYYEFDREKEKWSGFKALQNIPKVGESKFIDVDADGYPDLVVEREDKIVCYPFKGKDGFDKPYEFSKPISNDVEYAPTLGGDLSLDYFLADMTGDGLQDQVRIKNGRVAYYPNLGNGHFGEVVLMENSPVIDFDSTFDASRVRLYDLNGSGTTDILYIGRGEIRYWYNASGNFFIEGGTITNLPYIDNISSATILDFLGQGIPCLVWSNSLSFSQQSSLEFLELTSGIKPNLLISLENGMGKEEQIEYGYSGDHYLKAKRTHNPWISKIPSHFTVTNKKIVIDHVTNTRFTTEFKYRDGQYDGNERRFVTFGLVEQYDQELFQNASLTHDTTYSQPSCTKTWLHNGLFGWDTKRSKQYYNKDFKHHRLTAQSFEENEALEADDFALAYRSLAGKIIRQETYATNSGGEVAEHPYQVSQHAYTIRKQQPKTTIQPSTFFAYQTESLNYTYEQEADDPKISHHFSLGVNTYGDIEKELSISYARRSDITESYAAQQKDYITIALHRYLNKDSLATYQTGILYESKGFEINQLDYVADTLLQLKNVQSLFDGLVNNHIEFDQELTVGGESKAKLSSWNRTYFWNGAFDDVLPLSEASDSVFCHHEESACFNDNLIHQIFDSKITPAILTDTSEGNYTQKDNYWWQHTAINHFKGIEGFYNLARVERTPGNITNYKYDTYDLTIVEITDPLGNITKGKIDYNLVEPYQLIDQNDNISEVLYDPLGVVIVSTNQGTVLDDSNTVQKYGNNLIVDYIKRSDENFSNILNNPPLYLQKVGTFLFYDFDSSLTKPLKSIRLVRENLVHNGKGFIDASLAFQMAVDYQDGFGRIVQSKQKVESGLALQRKVDGSVALGIDGEPILAENPQRWLVTGHVVYNNKQQPVRKFEPFYSTIVEFENDTELETYGVSAQTYYDPVGRAYQVHLPNNTFTEISFSPWEVTSYDQNDTVDRSLYKTFREFLPDTDPEKIALNQSLAHKDTPTTIVYDVLGREIVTIQRNNDGTERTIEKRYDVHGNVSEIIDARHIIAFQYKRDMLGRLLYENSNDAGEKWNFYDNFDQAIHFWDARNIHQKITYDELDRVTSVHVDGALGLNQQTEQFVYGEAAGVVQAKDKNLRGGLVTHYDPAGIHILKKAAPGSAPLLVERRLLAQFTNEPDWSNPSTVALAADIFISQYGYDSLGRLIEQHLPDNTTRKIIFNQGGGVQKVLVSTADGILTEEEILKDTLYDAKGLRQKMVLGNDVELAYTYDIETFRMKRLRSRRMTGVARTYQDISYTYDPTGNLIHTIDAAQQPDTVNPKVMEGLNSSSHSEFEYDALYQLKRASGRVHQALVQNDYRDRSREISIPSNWGKGTRHIRLNNGAAVERYTRNYEFDIAGNIKSIAHIGVSHNWTKQLWTSATSNRSLPLLDLNGIELTNPENNFDANGNCISMSHLERIEWNYRNNISKAVVIDRSAQGKSNDEEHYVYSGDGKRIRKVTQRVVDVSTNTVELTEKIYLDGCEIKRITRGTTELLKRFTSQITDGKNNLATIHSWHTDTQARETDDISQKKIHYQLGNHLGSASLELDENGDIITYEEYFPYGGTAFIAGRNKREIDLKSYRYSAKERDDFTGLYYFGYRYYAHWIGGWINPDPLGPEDSENLYLYVHNNPVNLIDPNGLQSADPNQFLSQLFSQYNMVNEGSFSDGEGGLIEQFSASEMDARFDGSVFQISVNVRIQRNAEGEITTVDAIINEELRTDLEASFSIEGGPPQIRSRASDPIITTSPPTRTTPTTRSRPPRRTPAPTVEAVAETPETVTTEDGNIETPPPAEPEVCESEQEPEEPLVSEMEPEPLVSESEEPLPPPNECNSSPCESSEEDESSSRIPGSGLSILGEETVFRNPEGFTLEVPDNFDDGKIDMYRERIRTDRGVGNRSAVEGERLRPRGSDVTDVIRRDNSGLLDDWVEAEAAAGRTRPTGHHVDHGVELQHIIRGNETGGADTVRFEDHRFQPGRVNTSQGSSAMHTRHRAVAAGAPEDVAAGAVTRTSEIGSLRNSEELRTVMRGGGHILTIGGPLLSFYGATQISDQRVRAVAYTTTALEAYGAGAYYYGRVALQGANGFEGGLTMMATGSRFMRIGGGGGMIVTSVYAGYEHYQQGEYGVLLGDASGTGLGYMMLTQSGSTPLVAVTGTALAANYAGDYVESAVTPEYGRPAGIAAGTGVGLGIGAAVGGGLVAFGLVSNPVGWGILAVGGIAGFIGAVW